MFTESILHPVSNRPPLNVKVASTLQYFERREARKCMRMNENKVPHVHERRLRLV